MFNKMNKQAGDFKSSIASNYSVSDNITKGDALARDATPGTDGPALSSTSLGAGYTHSRVLETAGRPSGRVLKEAVLES